MRKRLVAPSLVTCCCVGATATIVTSAVPTSAQQCSLYLAPSTTTTQHESGDDHRDPHNMGIYAGTDLPPGTSVGHTDLVIPLVDVAAHVERYYTRKREEADRDALDVTTHHHTVDWHMSDMVWEPRHFGPALVGEGVDTKTVAPGLGTLVRGNAAMANVVHSRVNYDAGMLHRSRDPSVGSSSYYHDLATITTRPIKAGEELYENFGQHYYSDREGHQVPNTLADDPGAVDFFSKYKDVMSDHADILGANQGGVMDSLWAVIQDSPLQPSLQRILPKVWKRDAVEDLADSVVSGGHSPAWLAENGRCLDNIRPGQSTIPQAGRGAFATRQLVKGSVVGPAPVVHLPDRSLLDVREPSFGMVDDVLTGKQLLLNYCFGHNRSTVVLCNVGAGTSYINHASEGFEPNAKLAWSDHASLHNATWLHRSPDDLDGERTIGLMLEYVATRTIEPGEEILIDYGREWEQAWADHVSSWQALPGSADYVDAGVYNAEHGTDGIRTVKEQQDEPYPNTIDTSCYYRYVPGADEETDDPTQVRMVTRRWLNGMDGQGINLRPCRVLMRDSSNDGSEEYTVRILNSDETHHDLLIPDEERLIVTNVPRRAIVFTNHMYSTDMHLPNVFRHEIGLPEELFPDAWKNVL